jgi:hypothetical protein
MNTPYRDTRPAEDNEPAPDFGVDERLWPGLLALCGVLTVAAVAVGLRDLDAAIQLLVWSSPTLVSSTAFAGLSGPVGKWLAVRRARAVVDGVAALEAKVAAASARE